MVDDMVKTEDEAVEERLQGDKDVNKGKAKTKTKGPHPAEEVPDLDPAGMDDKETAPIAPPDPALIDAPLGKYVILDGPASYGPVRINGQLVRCKKNVLYLVPNAEERAVILGSKYFRTATKKDEQRAGRPSAGVGGAVTRELLPPGALRGGLKR